ncbi:MAG: NYN domain-containing protein [Verrucomicrobiota bacterium]|nr:NYN domain-containing protein [Verrucomicrobiota bacterium]
MSGVRYLLIDAYNVIYATSDLRKLMQGNIDSARDKLAKYAREIHDAEAVRVALILDSKSDKLQVEYPYESKRFEFIYAPSSLTADGVIERIVRRVKQPELVSVVSNDNMVRDATRSSGAMALRPEEFFDWSRASTVQLNQLAKSRSRSNDKNFENRLRF